MGVEVGHQGENRPCAAPPRPQDRVRACRERPAAARPALAVELDAVVLDCVTLLSVPDELDTEELVCEPEVEVAVPLLLVPVLVEVLTVVSDSTTADELDTTTPLLLAAEGGAVAVSTAV